MAKVPYCQAKLGFGGTLGRLLERSWEDLEQFWRPGKAVQRPRKAVQGPRQAQRARQAGPAGSTETIVSRRCAASAGPLDETFV